MKILLSGGGNPEKAKKIDEYFSNEIKDGRVLYIPIAMVKRPYDNCLEWFKNTYEPYNIKNIEMCIDLNKCKNLNKYDAIFIGGGNTINY